MNRPSSNQLSAKDLRIGNWVHIDDDGYGHSSDIQITYIDVDESVSYLRPIRLTEDWLERFGLYKPYDHFYWTFNDKSFAKFHFNWKEGKEQWYVEWDNAFIGYYKYVHQLQNLYFALTGEELKKLETA